MRLELGKAKVAVLWGSLAHHCVFHTAQFSLQEGQKAGPVLCHLGDKVAVRSWPMGSAASSLGMWLPFPLPSGGMMLVWGPLCNSVQVPLPNHLGETVQKGAECLLELSCDP